MPGIGRQDLAVELFGFVQAASPMVLKAIGKGRMNMLGHFFDHASPRHNCRLLYPDWLSLIHALDPKAIRSGLAIRN